MKVLKNNLASILNQLSPWLLLVAVGAFCWFLASTIWLLVAPPKVVSLPAVNLSTQAAQSSFSGDVFSLFKVPEPAAPEPTQSTVTNTNFGLEGVMLASPASMSSAIISENGISKRYRVGQKVGSSDYRLNEVSWKKVVLVDTQGNEVTVDLYADFDLNAAANYKQNANNPMANTTVGYDDFAGTPHLPPPISHQVSEPASPPLDIKSQVNNMLEKAANELQSNPAGYLNRMGVMATGDGYEITAAMNSDIRANIGLQPGDKVISVNGQSIGQPEKDAALLEEVKRTGSAEIQVQRGSQIITVRQQF